ncbi:hypothetical protein [Pacificibacter maritimus]|uniref:hypothetical protein n=1 Tax=Pacificibacter maritimus TaxID=762213 RepID=UPI001473D180|nr:hypothetical protein [Pacificibacter maritimus]
MRDAYSLGCYGRATDPRITPRAQVDAQPVSTTCPLGQLPLLLRITYKVPIAVE